MKRPSFQFYPADWQANSNLRRCSHEERGIWVDVMCLLHDQEEYGVIRWPLKEISQAIGCSLGKLSGLVSKGVLKGADKGKDAEPLIFIPRHSRKDGDPITLLPMQAGPIWYSSRMVVDEYKRIIRGESTPAPIPTPKPAPNPTIGATPEATPDPSPPRAGASSSSSSSPAVQEAGSSEPAPTGELPPEEKPKGGKKPKITLQAYLDERKASDLPVFNDGSAVANYAESVGMPEEFSQMAWRWFKHKHVDGDNKAKKQADWPSTFLNSLKGCWCKFWWLNGTTYELTTVGKQAQIEYRNAA